MKNSSITFFESSIEPVRSEATFVARALLKGLALFNGSGRSRLGLSLLSVVLELRLEAIQIHGAGVERTRTTRLSAVALRSTVWTCPQPKQARSTAMKSFAQTSAGSSSQSMILGRILAFFYGIIRIRVGLPLLTVVIMGV